MNGVIANCVGGAGSTNGTIDTATVGGADSSVRRPLTSEFGDGVVAAAVAAPPFGPDVEVLTPGGVDDRSRPEGRARTRRSRRTSSVRAGTVTPAVRETVLERCEVVIVVIEAGRGGGELVDAPGASTSNGVSSVAESGSPAQCAGGGASIPLGQYTGGVVGAPDPTGGGGASGVSRPIGPRRRTARVALLNRSAGSASTDAERGSARWSAAKRAVVNSTLSGGSETMTPLLRRVAFGGNSEANGWRDSTSFGA